jgi:hypothetical protein
MKKYYPQIISTILLLIILSPAIASAAVINGVDYGSIIPCDGVTVPCTFSMFATLINNIITWFLGISASVAACTFAWGGAQILLHPDEPGKKEEAKEILWKTVQGMIIILGAWLVIHTVIVSLTGATSGNGALRFLQG